MAHVSVLLHESVAGLGIKAGDTVIDATLGAGGHSSEIARLYGQDVTIVGFDLDADALTLAQKNVTEAGGKLVPIQGNFRNIQNLCSQKGLEQVNGVLFDFGVSSMELGESGRGFSFKYDEPLLMTLQNPIQEDTLTARDVLHISLQIRPPPIVGTDLLIL